MKAEIEDSFDSFPSYVYFKSDFMEALTLYGTSFKVKDQSENSLQIFPAFGPAFGSKLF